MRRAIESENIICILDFSVVYSDYVIHIYLDDEAKLV